MQDDFLKLPLDGGEYSSVDAVLLDPSCSGSGTAHTQLDMLLSPTGLLLTCTSPSSTAMDEYLLCSISHAAAVLSLQVCLGIA